MINIFSNHKLINKIILLITILLIALPRFYRLADLPAGFHNDEASFLVNSLAIKQTLHDEDGRFLPVYLNSYIDSKPALFSYLQIPFLFAVDNQLLAARLPGAIMGSLSVLAVGYHFYLLTKDRKFSLLITLLLAVSPWHIMVSRATQEVIASFLFLILSLICLKKLTTNLKVFSLSSKLFLWAGYFITGILSFYFYHSAKILWPLLSIVQIMLISTKSYKNRLKLSALIFTCCSILILMNSALFPHSAARIKDLSIFNQSGIQLLLDEKIRLAGSQEVSVIITRFFHNKIIDYSNNLIDRYSDFFTFSYLFRSGADPLRYVIPFHGLLYLIELPLMLIGLIWLVRQNNKLLKSKKKTAFLILLFLLAAPLPAIFATHEKLSMIRNFFMIIPLLFFTAKGIIWVLQLIKTTRYQLASFSILTVIYLLSFSNFWHYFSIFQPNYRPWNRNFADQRMAEKLKEIESDYEKIDIARWSGQPYVYLVLENLIAIEDLQQSYPNRFEHSFKLSKFQFVDSHCKVKPVPDQLYVIRDDCELKDLNKLANNGTFQLISTAAFADGAQGYKFVEFSPNDNVSSP